MSEQSPEESKQCPGCGEEGFELGTQTPNTADKLILESLASEGRNLPQNLARDLDYSRQYIQNRLQILEAAKFVKNIGGGLYELTDRGRDGYNDC